MRPTIAEGERPYTYALDRAVTGTGKKVANITNNLTVNITMCKE